MTDRATGTEVGGWTATIDPWTLLSEEAFAVGWTVEPDLYEDEVGPVGRNAMPEITKEWLETELALCAEKGAGGKYLALLQWALETMKRTAYYKGVLLDLFERERRLREALAAAAADDDPRDGGSHAPAAKALLEELGEVPHD